MNKLQKLRLQARNNLNKILLFISLIMIVIVFFIILNNSKDKLVYSREYEVIFSVVPGRAGFDTNNTALTFGIIPPEGSGKREVIIENNFDFSVEVKASTTKNLLEFIELEDGFVLESGESRKINVSINVPFNAEQKEYRGKLRLDFYKIKN